MRQLIEKWVNLESPSGDIEKLNALQESISETLSDSGAKVISIPLERGKMLYATLGEGTKRAVLIGHMDTVFEAGRAEKFDRENGRMYGAGVLDMKSGLAMIAGVFSHFRKALPSGWRLECVINQDEETGSGESAEEIMRILRGASFAMCFEPSPPGFATVARKGILTFEINVKGITAHASGGDPARRSAIRALVEILSCVYSLESDDISVNIGLIRGGGKVNVVSGNASAKGEIRSFSKEKLKEAYGRIREACKLPDADVKAEASVLTFRPSMEATEKSMALFDIAKRAAGERGFQLEARRAPGGSDGSYAAYVGVPVLDGMGAEGARAHTRREYVIEETLDKRFEIACLTIEEAMKSGMF